MTDNNFLDQIIEHKKDSLERKSAFYASLKKKTRGQKLTRYHIFKQSISRPGGINLIAEFKKASPSRGLIRASCDVLSVARVYVNNGAAAVSVLTEEKYFAGKISYLRQVSEHFDVPALMKDFIIDEVQIYEGFVNGASGILLIVALLDDARLEQLLEAARNLDMDCLVEVHNEEELERALRSQAEIIGINNRDLRSFKVDLDVSRRLIPLIPKDKVIVVESGIRTHDDIKRFEAAGAHAVLVGESFMDAPDIDAKMKEMMRGHAS